jgi:Holliday junction resolvase RusA-like endonuclease
MFDGGNRRKLIEDCLASALGIDDSLTFELTIVKRMDPEDPHVEIFLEEVDPCAYGVPREYTT